MTEAREDPGTEGDRLGEDPLARPASSQSGTDQESRSETEGDTGIEEFVEDMESDPARAGTDSPAQHLQGG